MDNNQIVVLFSGGTDSTLAAALMAQKYDRVHLVTYDRFGFSGVENPEINVDKLKNKYGKDKFSFEIIKCDNLSKHVFYERYLRNVFRYGFFLLSTCGLCKLAMHMRTIKYCLDNKIGNVCDGANKGMHLFPAQMKDVISEIKAMYGKFGINYENPVFDYEGPQDAGFADRLRLERVISGKIGEEKEEQPENTTGCQLCRMGLMPSDNVKGTELDRRMQPRCFQFILFNIFVKWYYLYNHSYSEYQKATVEFYQDKISSLTKVLVEYAQKGPNSKYAKLFTK